MAKIQNYLAELVFEQLPEFVQDQYPLFADFLHAYYKFLQQDKHAQEIIQNARAYADIEKTIAELIPSFFRQYGQDVPRNTEADTALFIKKMSDLYASKGTERGYKLLFNILYKEAIDFYYPYSNVLKPSDGKWIQTYRLFAYQDGNSDLFKFENSTITGATSGATATVSSVIRYAEQGFTIYELGLDADSVAGRFSSFERITARKLLRINGSNDPRAVIRDDLLDSEVYDYYKNRIDDLRRVLFKDEAGNDVGIRRLVNLGIRYGWTESQVLELYNLIFSVALDPITWSRTTPSVNHPATLNISNAYTYYSNNPIVFHDVMTENNAFASTVDQRIISTALEFGWTASQTADLVNKAFERATIAAEWDMFLQPTGPTYELVSGFLYPMLSEVDIVTPGLGYRPGETVSIQSNTGFSALAEVYEVDRSGGIKNVRVLRPGLNYNANTVLSIPRVLGRVQTAEQLVQNQIATLKFQNSHGLVKGDTITVAPDDFIATESNVLTVTIYSAGGDAVDKTHGVFIGDSAADVSNSNVGYTVSVYGSEEKAFVDHKTFDLSNGITESNLVSEQLSAEQYQNNYAVSNVLYVNNLGNIGGGNVHVMGASNTLTYFYIDDVVSHTKIKLSGMLHFVGEWNNEQVSLIEGANIVTRITKGAGDPVIAPAFAGQTNTYVGNQSYSSAVAVDKVIIDLAKPAEFETSTDAHVTDRSTVGISLNPISIIQTVVGVFGYLATDETFGTATDTFRSLTSVGKYSLENVSTLYFEVFRGGGVGGGVADPEYNNGAIINVVGDGSDFFKREVTVNGVRVMGAGTVGGQTAVSDAWLEKVARMFELFTDPTGAGINSTLQRNLIKNLSGDTGTYHAGLPTIQRVARGAGSDYSTNFLTDPGIVFWNLTNLFDTHVQNDMVWYLNSTGSGYGDGDIDAQEVIEHVFHTLHMHGLDAVSLKMYSYISADWASGPLYAAMEEAYDAGKWDSSGYGGNAWKTDGDAFEVAAKEYLYLLNFCMFEYTDLWDGNSLAPEWSDDMRTQAGIQANNPLGYAFHNTYIAPVISKPSLATIRSIFQDGNTPEQDNPALAGASGYVVDVAGGGVWGDAPESGEELKLQYSQDGVAWTNIVSVSIAVSDTTWTLVTATVPAGAKIPTGVYVRFYQDGSNDLAAPRDTWAFTSLVNNTTALSTNYGRVSFDTNWIEHTSNIITFSVLAPILAIELDQELYISNVSIDLERDPSLEMSTYLDSVAGNDIIMVHTWGDAKPNRLVAGLEDSMIAIGASGEIYGGDFADRSAYVLVGKPGIGEANGLEKLASVTNNDAANFARLRIKIDNGKLVGENISVVSIPDTRTIQYTKTAPDTQSNVLVLLETTANLAPKISPLVVSEPFWKNNDGMLSDAVFVQGRTRTAAEQDPVYYQNFSYVVQSEHPIAQWRKYALDLMHPAGMQLFGELKLQTLPSNVRDLKPIAVSTEVQDFFAITADKADRTHPESPDFRTDMTFFPSRNLETNPSLLEFDNNSHAVSQTFVGTDYVTVECFFRKLPDPLGPFNLPLPAERTLFSKYRSWEVRTDAGRLFYKIQTFADNRLYDWHWIDTGVFVQYGVPYVLALTYDGIHGKLYLNGTLVHRSTNSELRRNINNNPGVIANKNAHYPKLNASGNLRNSRLNPGTHAIGRFLIYDRALTEPELRENYLNLKGDFGI